MNLRRWVRKVEQAAQEATGRMTLIDERNGQTYIVPNDAFLKVIAATVEDEIDESIAELVDGLEDDPDRFYYLYIADSGERFWWAPEDCHRRGDDEE